MERPILFSTPMIQAILAGRKTQTRRIVKPQPIRTQFSAFVGNYDNIPYYARFWDTSGDPGNPHIEDIKCPYQKGMILWARETYTKLVPEHFITTNYVYKADNCSDSEEIRQQYIKQGYPYKWKPPIFMPKEACRISLEITNIRVERLQDISEGDAVAEGIESKEGIYKDYLTDEFYRHPKQSYLTLWTKINGKDSWNLNPWVWVIEFKRVNSK